IKNSKNTKVKRKTVMKKNKSSTMKKLFAAIRLAATTLDVSPRSLTASDVISVSGIQFQQFRLAGGFSRVRNKYLEQSLSAHPFQHFTKAGLGDIVKQFNVKKGRFFITSASPVTNLNLSKKQLKTASLGKNVVGSNVHAAGLKSILNFC